MQNSTALFKQIFNKAHADTDNLSLLEQYTAQHPYFALAQFYLLLQQQPGTSGHEKQAAKTASFFNNAYWLNFQLKKAMQPHTETRESISTNTTLESVSIADQEPILTGETIPGTGKSSPKTEEMLFEPMHTVDYFASQGIQWKEELHAEDKLGRQLKSFTGWLKTMKKIHQHNPTAIVIEDRQRDTVVKILAEKSNNDNEVFTESMAEVYIKQGKNDKALEVYKKLSLLDPAKSAYFAAKIEQLKAS